MRPAALVQTATGRLDVRTKVKVPSVLRVTPIVPDPVAPAKRAGTGRDDVVEGAGERAATGLVGAGESEGDGVENRAGEWAGLGQCQGSGRARGRGK